MINISNIFLSLKEFKFSLNIKNDDAKDEDFYKFSFESMIEQNEATNRGSIRRDLRLS